MTATGLRVLFVCRANECRSALAESYFRAALRDRGDVLIRVSSAGVRAAPGTKMLPECVAMVDDSAAADFRSRLLTSTMIAESDVVVAMTRNELSGVLRLWPRALGYAVTLPELARAAAAAPPPGPGDAARRLADLVAGTILRRGTSSIDPSGDDIPDPAGRPGTELRRAAATVTACVDRVVDRMWPASDATVVGRCS